MNIGIKYALAGSALVFLLGATTEINIGVNNQVNTGTIVGGNCRKGNGIIVKEQRSLEAFKDLAVEGVFVVNLSCGPKSEVAVTADKNLHPLIDAVVKNNKLSLSTTESYCTENSFVVDIVQKDLSSITADGSSELVVDCSSFVNDKLSVDLHGTTTLKISGTVKSLDLKIQDTAEFDGSELNAGNISIKASDATTARLNVTGKLTGTGTDASTIHYSGKPKVVDVDAQDVSEFTPED
ncbi:MAG: hypothetical protein A2X81_00420 [Desulfobacterales bacterium GWB2_56_26]|nr:MAG: hypothetical protein A2X81_00420 [Desulfobacterales bacterium GWB2_56_26]HBG20719.1 hypothetical protein [Desulfobulbaceae bacterium]